MSWCPGLTLTLYCVLIVEEFLALNSIFKNFVYHCKWSIILISLFAKDRGLQIHSPWMCLNIQLVLSHRVHVGQWAHLLKFIYNRQTVKVFVNISWRTEKGKKLTSDAVFLVWFLLYINFLLVALLLNVASKCNAKMPSGVSVLR